MTTRSTPPAELAAAPPISRLRYPDGSLGWLVTDYAAARFVLSDPRFSTRTDRGIYGVDALPVAW